MKYISILRGINVSGQKKINMQELKALYHDIGFNNVVTYIQSGNVIFESAEKNISKLVKKIELAIENKYKFHVPTLIRTHKNFKRIIENCPFGSINLIENGTKVLVSFLSTKPTEDNIEALLNHVVLPEQLKILNNEAYLYCPNGYGKSKLSNNFLERKLKVAATTRNWKSVLMLFELASK